MIKANELRIGNLFQDQNENLLKVSEINEENQVFKVVDRTKFPLPNGWKAEPIPLTEEILLKCGFEKKDESYVFGANKQHRLRWINKITGFEHRIVSLSYNVAIYDLHIKYLHQLQNLYFALTGEELKIEL